MPNPDPDALLAALVWRLPSLVALPLQDYLGEDRAVLKLWHACDTVEMLLRLLTSAGLADLARAGRLPDTLVNELRSRIEEPTLGSWRAMTEVVAAHLSKRPDCVLPELAVYVRGALVPFLNGQVGSERTTETSFIALRNRLAHGGAITKKRAKELCDHWAKSFEQIICAAAWLAEVDIVVRFRAKEFGVLRGATTEPAVWTPPDPAAVEAVLPREGEIALCRGGRVLPLAPLQFFGLPVLPECGSTRLLQATPLVYLRCGEVRLQFTPVGSEEACQSEGDATAWETFRRMFRLDEAEQAARSRDYLVRGFEADIRRDAERLVGRTREIKDLLAVLRERNDGVLWLSGPAGIGKSHLVARVANELLAEPPAGTLVLAYQFRVGDDRCSRNSFLQFANERLEKFMTCPAEKEADSQPKPLERFRELLGVVCGPGASETGDEAADKAATATRHVLLILDGLDEIAERDGRFAPEVVLSSSASGVTWLCAGREERGLDQVFAKSRQVPPGGLGPMIKDDIRAMLLDRIGKQLRQRLVANDRERGDGIINIFIDRVAKAADGLPLYVTYLIGDILGNRFRALDAGERLPESLVHYQEELLNRLGIDDVQQLKTTLAATLAVAFEPLSAAALADLLYRRTLLTSPRDVELVHRSLGAVGSIIRRGVTPEGEVGFTLYHQSLREHMFGSARMENSIATAKAALANAAIEPGASAPAAYLFRRGVEHLLESGRSADALRLLCSFPYLIARLQRLGDPSGVAGIDADWHSYKMKYGTPVERDARIAEAFWREKAHILRRGSAEWPAYKILLQLAVEHAEDSPLSIGAERWIAEGRCSWIWLRRVPRLPKAQQNPCLAVLEGHTGSVYGALHLSGGHLLSWSGDNALRLWNLQHGACRTVLQGHTGSVRGALQLADGRLLSWSGDKTLRLWDTASGGCLAILEGHTGSIRGAVEMSNGRLVSWSGDSSLRIWDSLTGHCEAALEGHTGAIIGALPLADGCVLSWSADKTLRLWGSRNGVCLRVLEGHIGLIKGALSLADGQVLSWADDKTLRLWNLQAGVRHAVLQGHAGMLGGALRLADGRLLSWSSDRTLRLWYGETGACHGVLKGHGDVVSGALQLTDGRLLSWSYDKSLRVWSGQDGAVQAVFEGHTGSVYGAVELIDGRVLSWSGDRSMRIWDSWSGHCEMVYEGHVGSVNGASQLVDGRLLSWSGDSCLRIWDSQSGGRSAEMKGHDGAVYGVVELADGRFLSWSDDNTLRLWDGQSGVCLAVISEEQCAQQQPEWIQARRAARCSVNSSLTLSVVTAGRSAQLRHKTSSAILAAWHADSNVRKRCLLLNRNTVVRLDNGQVCFLKPYCGNHPISIHELEIMGGYSPPSTAS